MYHTIEKSCSSFFARFVSVSTKLDTFYNTTKKKLLVRIAMFPTNVSCIHTPACTATVSVQTVCLMLYFNGKIIIVLVEVIYIKFVSHFIAMNHDITWENSDGKMYKIVNNHSVNCVRVCARSHGCKRVSV